MNIGVLPVDIDLIQSQDRLQQLLHIEIWIQLQKPENIQTNIINKKKTSSESWSQYSSSFNPSGQ